MFSFVGDTICDPFMGSGTTALAAMKLGRNTIGYEINREFRRYYHEKLSNDSSDGYFEFYDDNNPVDTHKLLNALPYLFIDVHQLERSVDVKQQTYGSKFEVGAKEKELNQQFMKIIDSNEATVIVNHARPELRKKMIETGICYLRAGDSKGSLLVVPGFERLEYVLLHTNGEDAQMFKLRTKGHFQIWTRETLQEYGFQPQNARYYVVLHFNAEQPIAIKKRVELKEKKYTFHAKIKPLSDFTDIR